MRYLPHTDAIRTQMLEEIGANTIDDLFKDIPTAAKRTTPLPLPSHQGEIEVDRFFKTLAGKNLSAADASCFLGGGAYRHHIPSAVDALIQRGEYLTSYTPYQPEIAQGTLQYLFEFQTQVCLLTGMEVANASLYDGATAAVEAVMMANRVTKRKKSFISGNLHPHYREVIKTYSEFADFEVVLKDPAPTGESLSFELDDQTSCVVVQYPDFFGHVQDFTCLAEKCHEKGALLIVVVTEVVALGLLKAPGDIGADIVAAEGQSIGVGLNFGGPTVGLLATKETFLRQIPGRIAGQTVDVDGKRGWVLTLSTREQHIRREKATSNICTNSGLCALAFTIHLSLLGESGLKCLAKLNHSKAIQLHKLLSLNPKIKTLTSVFFNEFVLELPKSASAIVEALAHKKILGGIPVSRLYPGKYDNLLLIAVTELNTDAEISEFASTLNSLL